MDPGIRKRIVEALRAAANSVESGNDVDGSEMLAAYTMEPDFTVDLHIGPEYAKGCAHEMFDHYVDQLEYSTRVQWGVLVPVERSTLTTFQLSGFETEPPVRVLSIQPVWRSKQQTPGQVEEP